jgi:hypothetical protein
VDEPEVIHSGFVLLDPEGLLLLWAQQLFTIMKR